MAIRAGSGDGRSAPCGGAARLEAAARGSAGNDNDNGAATAMARASRKSKPKKIPQRSLGVAQLEKLRIEEQKKMGGGPSAATPSSHALNGRALCHLPPQPPLSPLSRPAAADHCGFKPALWNPADPAKHSYKRSPCPATSTPKSNGEHEHVPYGAVEPPNGAPFKPNVQQRQQEEQRGDAGADIDTDGG
ncbi:hypothetical protein ZWY2020_010165 [Hordeum vulgare]|nr:hypothetical protein ZWY2020_010165 [Hordeum vulgare]